MAHTHTLLLYHIVFSTKHRAPLLTAEIRPRLFAYMCGVVEKHQGKALIVNGIEDHVHLLCQLRSTPDLASVVHAIKGGSSAWWNESNPGVPVRWQEGYGAFTVSVSQRNRVHAYIRDQEEHHESKTFSQEYEAMLALNGIEFDSRFHLD